MSVKIAILNILMISRLLVMKKSIVIQGLEYE